MRLAGVCMGKQYDILGPAMPPHTTSGHAVQNFQVASPPVGTGNRRCPCVLCHWPAREELIKELSALIPPRERTCLLQGSLALSARSDETREYGPVSGAQCEVPNVALALIDLEAFTGSQLLVPQAKTVGIVWGVYEAKVVSLA